MIVDVDDFIILAVGCHVLKRFLYKKYTSLYPPEDTLVVQNIQIKIFSVFIEKSISSVPNYRYQF